MRAKLSVTLKKIIAFQWNLFDINGFRFWDNRLNIYIFVFTTS